MTKLVKKIHKIHDPLDLDNKLLDPLGLPSLAGKENGLIPEEKAISGSTVEAPAAAPSAVGDDVMAARDAERRRQLAAAGMAGTNLTGPSGLRSRANTQTKSLLGS